MPIKRALLKVGPLIDLGLLIEKLVESSCRDRVRRTPAAFPILDGPEFRRKSCADKDSDGSSLAQIVSLTPRFEAQDNGSDFFGRRESVGFLLFGKEPLKCCSRYCLRRTTSNLPLLKRPERNWQSSCCQRANSLGLTQIVHRSPVLEPSDQGTCH